MQTIDVVQMLIFVFESLNTYPETLLLLVPVHFVTKVVAV